MSMMTNRQQFRTRVIENITIPIIGLPYLATRYCGRFHLIGLCLGIVLVSVYAMFLYRIGEKVSISKVMSEGTCRLLRYGYFARIGVRTCFMLGIISRLVDKHFGINAIAAAVIFGVLCFVCAGENEISRARSMELLYYITIYPLLIFGAVAISDIKWNKLISLDGAFFLGESKTDFLSFVFGVFLISSLFSGMESMLYSRQRQEKLMFQKTVIWILVFVVMSYAFTILVGGADFVSDNLENTVRVYGIWESFSDIFLRFDYAILVVLIVLSFGNISGGMFYAKDLLGNLKRSWLICFFVIAGAVAVAIIKDSYRTGLFLAVAVCEVILSVLFPIMLYVKEKK